MKNILQRLYDGDIAPYEQYRPRMEEHLAVRDKLCRHYDTFAETLHAVDPALKQQFARIMDEQIETVPFESAEMFIDGFCLGVRRMSEVYQHDNVGS